MIINLPFGEQEKCAITLVFNIFSKPHQKKIYNVKKIISNEIFVRI